MCSGEQEHVNRSPQYVRHFYTGKISPARLPNLVPAVRLCQSNVWLFFFVIEASRGVATVGYISMYNCPGRCLRAPQPECPERLLGQAFVYVQVCSGFSIHLVFPDPS